MKLIITSFILLCTFSQVGFSQTNQSQTTLFAQCLFTINDATALEQLQQDIASNPNVKMVRLDMYSQRAFILTQNISSLNETELKSWFNQFESTVHCIQIGVYGIDQMWQYPFTNCQ